MRVAAVALALAFGITFADATRPAAEETAAEKSQLIAAGRLTLSGRKMRCGGMPTLMSTTFWDYGGTDRRMIILNPTLLETLPPTVQFYIYEHECGHKMRGASETRADCYAVERGRRDGWLTREGLQQICAFFQEHPSDGVHPPGPERCAAMTRCFDNAAPRRVRR